MLPTHYSYAWTDALGPTVAWESMARGAMWSLAYSTVLLGGGLVALPPQGRRELTAAVVRPPAASMLPDVVADDAGDRRRVPVDLTGVPETLLWTLYYRAQEAARADGVLTDPLAVDVVARIDYPFEGRLGHGERRAQWQALRAATFDGETRSFLAERAAAAAPAVVVALGEGLETAFWRVDDGRVRWLGVDLPQTGALRRAVLPADPRRTLVDASALDDGWLDAVRDSLDAAGTGPQNLLVTAQGLLMYLQPRQVRDLVRRCAEAFPGARLLFDGVPWWTSRVTTSAPRRPATGAFVAPPMPWPVSPSQIRALRALPGVEDVARVRPPRGRGAALGVVVPVVERLPVARDVLLSVWRVRFAGRS